MKRALALILITSMLSTSTVYAAGDPEAYSDSSVYAGERSQSGDYADYGSTENYSYQEDYSDSGSGYSGMSGEYGSEAGNSDAGYADNGSGAASGDTGTAGSGGAATSSDAGYVDTGNGAASGETGVVQSGGEATSTNPDAVKSSVEAETADTGTARSGGEAASGDAGAVQSGSNAASGDAGAAWSGSNAASASSGSVRSGGNAGSTDTDASYSGGNSDRNSITISYSNEDSEASSASVSASGSEKAETQVGSADGNSTRTRIAIMSDIHYVTDQLISELGRGNLVDAALTEDRLMEEIDAILTAALKGASKAEPDALLICGDLVSNGELLGAKALAAKLKAAKENGGFDNTGFYVVNGNHDINNSYAADFTGSTVDGASRVQPSDFKEIFSGLGYGDDDHWAGGSHSVYVPTNDDPSATTNHGGLSYSADIADGITLIVLDTGIYQMDESEQSMYNDAQKTAGYVSDDLLAWAAEQAKEAKAKGNLVLAMSHHGLLPHYDTDLEDKAAWYMESFRVPNWENVAETLADAGVSAVLTGHTHANDIASYVSKNNNVLYDVETAALCAYPCLWRAFDIVTTGEGDEKTYTISIDTTYINDDLEADTSSWSFTIGDKTKTFDGDYNGNLQDYAYEKSGINEEMLEHTAMYMIKNTLSDIVNHEGGLAGYIKERLNIPEDKSLGDYAVEAIRNAVSSFTSFTQNISAGFISGDVTIENATKEEDANPTLSITATLSGRTEHGTASIDLSYLPTAVDELAAKTQTKLLEGDWLKNPYASNPLLDDISNLLKKGLVPALSQPLKEDDPESTAVKLFNHAWQAFSKGDEGLADDAQKAKWEEERELLGGEVLADKMTQGIWTEALKLNSSQYPTLAELFSQRIANENSPGIVTLTTDDPGDYLLPAINALLGLGNVNTLSSVIRTASSLNALGMGNPLPSSMVKPVTDKIVDLHEVMTTDNNIKHDNTWDIQMVRFDANGGSVSRTHALTVEDHKLASLPTPDEREGYTFDGWFTSETGGKQVTPDDDMTGISTLYAHWTLTDKSRDDEEQEPETPDEEDKNEEKPEEDKNITPEKPAQPAKPNTVRGRHGSRGRAAGDKASWDLHRYFVSRKALHDKILNVELSDLDHEKFCAAVLSALKDGETIFNMGEWLSLSADVVAAIEEGKEDVTLEYVGQSIGFRVVIPAGAKISRLADEKGSVCVVCLAETYGYERIGEEDLLRQCLA